jgi:hypothetical protein
MLGGDAGELVGDLVGGKLSDWRSSRAGNSHYATFAADVERYVAEDKKAHRFEYGDLEKFVYRKNMRLVMGVGTFISLQFKDQSFYFDVGDDDVVEPAIAIIEDLAPQAVIKKKTGAMVKRS